MNRKPLGPWVVAGVDGSPDALAAVEVAAAEAAMRGLRLRLVAACPLLGAPAGLPGVIAARVEVNQAVAEAASRAHLTRPDLTVRTLVVDTDPAEALILESRTAGLVVVGARGRGDAPSPGSVCSQVAAYARCPAIVVPSNMDRAAVMPTGPVVVGVDAGGWDDAAIGFAFEEAQARGVPLRAAHVWSGVPDGGAGCVEPFRYRQHAAWAAADRRLAETLEGWAEKYPRVPVRRVPLYDANPGPALLLASDRAGLVVVGMGPHTRHHGELLGTTIRVLIGRASCPVCVVRTAVR